MGHNAPSPNRPKTGDLLTVQVDRLVYGAEGIGRVEGLAVFVKGGAPGETVRARVTRTHRRHIEATVESVEIPSPHRVAPICGHYDEGCGGCSWQHVAYEAQLAAKEAAVRDSLERIAGFSAPPMRPILPAPSPFRYRNKMEFAFHPEGLLGLHPKGAWYDILSLRECHLPSLDTVAIVQRAQTFVRENNLSLYHPRRREGLLRDLVVRHSGADEILLGIVTSPGEFPQAKAMAAFLAQGNPRIASVVRSIRSTPDSAAPLEGTQLLFGRSHITEIMGGLRFGLRIETFFQTNTVQGNTLVELVKGYAGDIAGAEVVDVYCGVGVFTLALASMGAKAMGVELVPAAIEAARENALANGIEGTRFFAGDARHILAEVLPAGLAPKVLVLDPPRGGAGGKVMRRIARSEPARIIYISCNPTTLARDLMELVPFGYRVALVQPVDMFPQTYHVETIVVLEGPTGGAPATGGG